MHNCAYTMSIRLYFTKIVTLYVADWMVFLLSTYKHIVWTFGSTCICGPRGVGLKIKKVWCLIPSTGHV